MLKIDENSPVSRGLSRAKWHFDEKKAQKAVDFFPDCLRHIKGEWAGRPVFLAKWQQDDIIRPLFGWVDAEGYRQYRTVYVEIPRKNGKSTMAAGVGLYLTVADDEPGAEVYSCAADKGQAAIVFDVARAMTKASQFLSDHTAVYRRSIVVPRSESSYIVISADAKTKHGYNSHGIIFDEFHTQPNRHLYDVMATSTGSRRQPVMFIITTAGYDQTSICYELHDYAIKVRDGIIDDPTFLPVIYAADPGEPEKGIKGDDWKAIATWKKANPNYGVSLKEEYMQTHFNRALASPAYENTFKRLDLNIWTEQATRWMPMDLWDSQPSTDLNLRKLRGRECFGGLDLASVYDLNALALLFPPLKDDGVYDALLKFWVPKDRSKQRGKVKDIIDGFVRRGLITETPGRVVDTGYIAKDINKLGDLYKIREIGFDPWNATDLTTDLDGDGFTMVPIRQGYASLTQPTNDLMKLALSERINHYRNPVLRWMVSNTSTVSDPAGNIKPDREHSSGKIDGVVALIMAVSRAMVTPESKPSVYEKRGLQAI